MTEKTNSGGLPTTREKHTPAFQGRVRAPSGSRSPAIGCGPRPGLPPALAQAVPSSAERAETKQLRAHSTAFVSLEEVRLEVACYLGAYFNLDCRHSALGCRSPHKFEQEPKTNLP